MGKNDTTHPLEFIRWVIEYTDGNQDVKLFNFNNTWAFYRQVVSHMMPPLQAYFRDFYSSHGIMANAQLRLLRGNSFIDDHQEWFRVVDEYRRRLGTPDRAVRLSQLTPANAFKMLPLYFCVAIHIHNEDGTQELDEVLNEIVLEKIDNLLVRLNSFTNYRLNANVTVNTNIAGRIVNGSYRWFYLQGERVFDLEGIRPNFQDSSRFETHVFESYRDIFW